MGLLDGLIGTFVGLHGMNKAAQAQRQLEGAQQAQIAAEKGLGDYYNQQANTDYLNTAAAKSGLAKVRDQYKQTLADANSNMAAGGATDEAKVALKSGLQKGYNQTLSNLVGYGTQYQNAMKQAYGGTLSSLYNMNKELYQPKINSATNSAAAGWSAAEQGFGNAASNLPKKGDVASLIGFLA